MKKTAFLLTIIFLSIVSIVQAQEPVVTMTVSESNVTTDDTILLTITIENAGGASQPTLPDLSDFQVLGSSRSSQTTIVNGDISSQVIYNYTLRPIAVGTLTINPVEVVINGQAVRSQALVVQVEQGTQPIVPNLDPSLALLGDDDFYMVASVDKSAPYVGEQIVYTVQAFLRAGLQLNVPYDLPDFDGFWRHDTSQTDNRQIIENENGRYHIFEFQTIAFPMLAGERVIEPTALGVDGALQKDNLHTEPITVSVRPLPQPAPADFTGATGQLEIVAVVDKQAVAVDESVTLRVAVRGTGNIGTLPEPDWPEITDWRVFDNDAVTQTEVDNGRLIGQRLYERILIPNSGGEFVIPPITYTFFNPATEQYETASTAPISISVAGDVVSAATAAAAAPQPIEPTDPDIRHIKPAPTSLTDYRLPLTDYPLYWALWAVPLLALALDVVWRRQGQGIELEQGRVASLTGVEQQAMALLREGDGFTAVHQALTHYLSHKLGQPIAGLTEAEMRQLLAVQGIAVELQTEVVDLLAWSAIGRFAPARGESKVDEAVIKTQQVITNLEQIL